MKTWVFYIFVEQEIQVRLVNKLIGKKHYETLYGEQLASKLNIFHRAKTARNNRKTQDWRVGPDWLVLGLPSPPGNDEKMELDVFLHHDEERC